MKIEEIKQAGKERLIYAAKEAFAIGDRAGEEAAWQRKSAIQLAVVLIVAAIGCVWMYNSMMSEARSGKLNMDSMDEDAHYTAEQFIKKQTAGAREVSSYRDSVVTHDGSTYYVACHVDGLNAFGGPVRQALIVEMKLDGGTWSLVGIHHK